MCIRDSINAEYGFFWLKGTSTMSIANCGKCSKDITSTQKYYKAQNKCYHEGCFSHSPCATCGKSITSGQVYKLPDSPSTYHATCFKCVRCANDLGFSNTFVLDKKLWCSVCVDKELKAEKAKQAPAQPQQPKEAPKSEPPKTGGADDLECTECGNKLSGKIIKALGKKWHKACWVCRACKCQLPEDFNQFEGYPYCEKCYALKFAPKCAGCNEAIIDSVLKALDKKWHRKCFVCTKCKGGFEGGAFFVRDSKPYCSKC
eukprot:TRINITY_DN9126_c0_g1_i1.p1 TRINITY_DN9126_c0_g1~~TRINITY_DN9126_c0_g1_i1.p1  ORF type:complete len:259 (-),score=28.90 TRINITY_DN9126_c0_g1_i1:14-790(-)